MYGIIEDIPYRYVYIYTYDPFLGWDYSPYVVTEVAGPLI